MSHTLRVSDAQFETILVGLERLVPVYLRVSSTTPSEEDPHFPAWYLWTQMLDETKWRHGSLTGHYHEIWVGP